jgi:hypothetical protein
VSVRVLTVRKANMIPGQVYEKKEKTEGGKENEIDEYQQQVHAHRTTTSRSTQRNTQHPCAAHKHKDMQQPLIYDIASAPASSVVACACIGSWLYQMHRGISFDVIGFSYESMPLLLSLSFSPFPFPLSPFPFSLFPSFLRGSLCLLVRGCIRCIVVSRLMLLDLVMKVFFFLFLASSLPSPFPLSLFSPFSLARDCTSCIVVFFSLYEEGRGRV